MKNIRLFLQFVIFLVVVMGAIVLAPKLGQLLEDHPYNAGSLEAPAIEHHGAGHEEGGEVHGEATGHEEPAAHGEAAVPAEEPSAEPAVAPAEEPANTEEAPAATEAEPHAALDQGTAEKKTPSLS